MPKVWESLKPGGLIVVEGFHADTVRVRPIGGGYTDSQMFETLKAYRIDSHLRDIESGYVPAMLREPDRVPSLPHAHVKRVSGLAAGNHPRQEGIRLTGEDVAGFE